MKNQTRLSASKKKIIDKILSEVATKGFCHSCGKRRFHGLVYCPCGGKFCTHNHIVGDLITMWYGRYNEKPYSSWMGPRYVYDANFSRLEGNGISEEDFVQYCEDNLR